jgi:hypothetical protein
MELSEQMNQLKECVPFLASRTEFNLIAGIIEAFEHDDVEIFDRNIDEINTISPLHPMWNKVIAYAREVLVFDTTR